MTCQFKFNKADRKNIFKKKTLEHVGINSQRLFSGCKYSDSVISSILFVNFIFCIFFNFSIKFRYSFSKVLIHTKTFILLFCWKMCQTFMHFILSSYPALKRLLVVITLHATQFILKFGQRSIVVRDIEFDSNQSSPMLYITQVLKCWQVYPSKMTYTHLHLLRKG